VCLTVVDKAPGSLSFDVSAESVSRTATDMWTEGRRLNLERALRLGDELGGHIVTGHVDAVGTVVAIEPEGGSLRVTIEAPRDLAPYVAAKGSITVDGVSLTVNSVEDTPQAVRFGLNIIPHTAEVTTFADLSPGRAVNLEIDVLARYLQRMEQARAAR
jgi:riboflavin synthase